MAKTFRVVLGLILSFSGIVLIIWSFAQEIIILELITGIILLIIGLGSIFGKPKVKEAEIILPNNPSGSVQDEWNKQIGKLE